MKIWYQSFTSASLYGAYLDVLRARIQALAQPGIQVDVHPLRKGGMGTQYHYLEHLQVTEVLDNVERAVEQGYDAFAIGHFTDAGLQAAREVAAIPVLGLGETSMLTACTMGHRFGLVGINPKSLDYIGHLVRGYGLESRLAATATMACPDPGQLEAAFHDPAVRGRVLQSFAEAAGQATREGAEVVIAAGGVVMALTAQAGLYATCDGAIVLDGVAALVHGCVAAVRTRQAMGGHFTSRNLGYAPPGERELPGIREHYGAHVYRSLKPGAE